MKKPLKIIAIGVAILFGIVFISMIFSGDAQKSFDKGMNQAKETVESMEQ